MHENPTPASGGRRNALAAETSPYLLQHASNPVDWHPWGEAALVLARASGKPILLSIGYSACHWCHVMAHESFADEETAALMNDLFVNIKVDREERPDLDKIYQTAQQLLNRRHGGWPLTMFLTHDDQVPFAGGTYFPKEARWGMPSFRSVLRHIAEIYRDRLDDIRQQNAAVLEALEQVQAPGAGGDVELTSVPLLGAREQLEQMYDEELGGFGKAPKFPHPLMIERLLRHYAASERLGAPDERALEMAMETLRAMAEGGIYDHLGGGFARYSTDAEWTIPHFEKMLYDNGPLLALYAEAWQITGDELFARTAIETGEWLMREMQSPAGGYYSSLDADSEGKEGRFYVWTRDAIREILTPPEYRCFAPRYGIDQPANFEGAWHLRVATEVEVIAAEQETSVEAVRTMLDQARSKLLAVRNGRVWPGRDEKVLGSWNALAIRGMAVAGRILGRPDFVASASRALDFLHSNLWRDGRLLAAWKDGRGHLPAYLDDYAFLLDAILALLQVRWQDGDLEFATALADTLLDRFEDREHGGFFFTGHDHEALIQRPRGFTDDALPSGNGVAAAALTCLGHLCGQERYLGAAERTVAAGWAGTLTQPTAHLALLLGAERLLVPPELVRILSVDLEEGHAWWKLAHRAYRPDRQVFAPAAGLATSRWPMAAETTGTVALVCTGSVCETLFADRVSFEHRMTQNRQNS